MKLAPVFEMVNVNCEGIEDLPDLELALGEGDEAEMFRWALKTAATSILY